MVGRWTVFLSLPFSGGIPPRSSADWCGCQRNRHTKHCEVVQVVCSSHESKVVVTKVNEIKHTNKFKICHCTM